MNIFYTHRARTSTILVKKSIKMHSIACQFWKKKIHVVLFFRFELYTQKNIIVGFTNILLESLITMRNDLEFWKNICQVKYAVFRNLTQYFFQYFLLHIHTYIHWKIIQTVFLWVVKHASHEYSHISIMFS